jgi:hypothetical protein
MPASIRVMMDFIACLMECLIASGKDSFYHAPPFVPGE